MFRDTFGRGASVSSNYESITHYLQMLVFWLSLQIDLISLWTPLWLSITFATPFSYCNRRPVLARYSAISTFYVIRG